MTNKEKTIDDLMDIKKAKESVNERGKNDV